MGLALTGMAMAAACGGTSGVEVQPAWTNDPGNDKIAFYPSGSDTVTAMAADGTNARPMEGADTPGPVWPNQEYFIKRACSMTDDVDIEVVSADGASLGSLDDGNWTPEISPVEPSVLVACAQVDGDKVLLVSDIEVEGSRDGWSRSGRADLSDRIEIKVVAIDGSEIREVTSNQAGDWLPRWSPDGSTVVLETNRDGNSEIYVIDANPRVVHRLTNSASPDLAPVWSRDGNFVAFTHRGHEHWEVWVTEPDTGNPQPTGHYGRPLPWSR